MFEICNDFILAQSNVGGVLGGDQRPAFHEYVMREGRSSYVCAEPVRPGKLAPRRELFIYRVPPEYGIARRYRYAIVSQHAVLLDPKTRRIVQVID